MGFALDVQAGHFQSGVKARIGEVVDTAQDLEFDRFEMERVEPDDAGLELEYGAALVAAADLAQTDEAFVRDDFDDGSQEVAWMHAGVVTQLAVQRNGHGACLEIDDFHGNGSLIRA